MNYKVELINGLTFICNEIEAFADNIYAVTIGDSVSFISISSVRWIDPTFESTIIFINRNQAKRIANVVRVTDKALVVKYQMPNGKVFHNYLFADGTYKSFKFSL